MVALIFPDAEALLVTYLRSTLAARGDTAFVGTYVPNTRPARMVRISRVGGTRRNVAQEDAMCVFECWAPDSTQAFGLAQVARALVQALDTVDGFFPESGEISGPQFFPDPLTTDPRYQFTEVLRLRARPLEDP